MSWQKTARFGLAAFVVVFGTIVFVALKQRKPAAPVEAVVRLRDSKASAETSGGVWEQFKDRKVVWSMKFDRQSSYPDGRTKLKDHKKEICVMNTAAHKPGEFFTGVDVYYRNSNPSRTLAYNHYFSNSPATGWRVLGADRRRLQAAAVQWAAYRIGTQTKQRP